MSFLKYYDHLKIQMKDILLATDNFDSTKVIGSGGFGWVYKGELSLLEGPIIVAFKKLDRRLGQGNIEFWKEVMMLSKYKHENLVSLMYYCIEGDEMILGYEYASRGSLDRYLSDTNLTWTRRLKISVEAARGLNYLHDPRGAQERVIHRDIKSGNILLDENWMAKVSDFGLSKVAPANQAQTVLASHAVGTPGYCDPVYLEIGFLSKESDVYSFGVVLFEILCGRLCYESNNGKLTIIFVPKWRQCYEEKILDEIIFPGLKEQMDPGSLNAFSAIAYQCVKKAREDRPMMAQVVKELEFALQQHLHDQMQQKIRVSQGQQQFPPSPYNNPTGGRHLEQNYDVSRYTPERDNGERNSLILNSQMNQSLDNDNHQKFASRPVSQNTDHVYDNNQVNNRFEDRAKNSYFQPSPMNDGVDSYALEGDGPGIEGFQIIGDAKPGGKLLGCGFPVRGTSLCMFQWVRHLQDGTREYVEGATNPEYIVTADDVDKFIAVACIPMDDQGRQGGIVRLFANKKNKVTCDPEMQQEIDKYMSASQASFGVLLLMDSSENWEQTTFSLRRSSYQIKINRTQSIIIDERYTDDLSIKIPVGVSTQFVLTRPNGSSHPFNAFNDVRMRDTVVLTMRMFQSKALDERRKTKARNYLFVDIDTK